jgi:alkylated DNA repair dioxygenase AlkB
MNHYQHVSNFLSEKESTYLFDRLLQETPWTQVKYYKPERGYVITPRLTWVAGFHQKNLYTLDIEGKSYTPNLIPPWLVELKSAIENHLSTKYNYLLFSLYRDEKDSIAYHSDDESFLGYNPNIASITVGASRPFNLKHKHAKEVESFTLKHGDLFVMKNDCQRNYTHTVPKQPLKAKPRISITFRNALNESASKNYYKYNTMNFNL